MTDPKTPCRWCSQPPTSHPNPMCDEYGTPGPADVPVHCCACGESFELSDQPGAIYPLVNGICRPCWKLIRRPNHAIVAENHRLKEANAALERSWYEWKNDARSHKVEVERLREERNRFAKELGDTQAELDNLRHAHNTAR